MGQQSLIYSFVARGTMILAEYTEFSGNFNSIASQCLQKLPSSNNRFTYNCDGHTFNYLVESGFSKSCIFGLCIVLIWSYIALSWLIKFHGIYFDVDLDMSKFCLYFFFLFNLINWMITIAWIVSSWLLYLDLTKYLYHGFSNSNKKVQK